MKKALYLILGVAVLGAVAWAVFAYKNADNRQGAAAKPKAPPTVVVAGVLQGDIVRLIDLDGSIEATRIARIASPAEGPIGNCRLREGDRVKKGQQVLCIGRRETVEAQLAAAREDLAKEEAELARVKKLVENGAIPADQLAISKARTENARAQLIRLQQSNEDYRLFAPWDGIVARVMVLEGDYVAPRAPLMEIIDPRSLVLRFAVPEASAPAVAIGKDIEVTLDAYPGHIFTARISRVYPRLDPVLRTRTVEAKLEPGLTLLPGMFARLRLEVERAENAVIVPSEALLTSATGGQAVFVIKDGKARRVPVVTGIEADGRVQIVKGIAAGDKAVVAGQEKLKDGAAVKVATPKDKTAAGLAPKAGS